MPHVGNAVRVRRVFGFVVAAALLSTALLLLQGGFGGGHGDYDRVIAVLALPWSLIPLPERVYALGDFAWLVVVPLVCNLACAFAIVALASRRRH